MSLLMKGMAHSSSNRSTTHQRPDDTLCFQHVASGSKASSSSTKQELKSKPVFHLQLLTGAPPSHMKPRKSAKLTQPDAHDTREDNACTEISDCGGHDLHDP